MDFEFSADQEMLRDSVRRFLADKAPISYVRERPTSTTRPRSATTTCGPASATSARSACSCREEHGGAGMGMVDAAVVLEELGRSLCPAPYASTAIGAVSLVLGAGASREHRFLLPGLADGSTIGTLAVFEPGSTLPLARSRDLGARRR